MNIEYSDSVKQWPEGFELAKRATADLETVVGPKNAPNVSGRWDRTGDEGAQGQFTLRLHNPDGQADGRFEVNDMRSQNWRMIILHGLWGNILLQRAERHLRNLRDEEEGNAA